ncbi:hypothetical protein CWC46_12955 [Prodigiosinella confusarubida]|uniref:Toxin SymE-like domain-containing protein n=1 Tax=Serratia sp. (strain ATCC 39006) TaxID=104623 RepID=A0A2I5TD66_SERS3|nr:hypothetical protein CWC46_12955 [Serratia sp. ATCC 39006]AUH06836.1 hypothetical protein Ser39006_012960 [Serratia sp. ATCC 39006]
MRTNQVGVSTAGQADALPLTLKGRWLEDLGFNTGQSVIVTIEHGQLLIRIVAE